MRIDTWPTSRFESPSEVLPLVTGDVSSWNYHGLSGVDLELSRRSVRTSIDAEVCRLFDTIWVSVVWSLHCRIKGSLVDRLIVDGL